MKSIKASDSFRLCKSLCFLCHDKLFRHLLLQHLSAYEEEVSDASVDDSDDKDSAFGASLTRGVYSFTCHKDDESTDDRFRCACNFLKIVIAHKSHKHTCECGDIPALESAENGFCAVFVMMNKCNYVELILSKIERRHGELSCNELKEVRITSAIRCEKDEEGATYSARVLDDLVENVNRSDSYLLVTIKICGINIVAT